AALVTAFLPWNIATIVGVFVGSSIPPRSLGLDVVFPAAMAGLAAGLVTGRREVAAGLSAGLIGVAVSLAWDTAVGTAAGGLIGPLVGLAVPGRNRPGTVAEPEGRPTPPRW